MEQKKELMKTPKLTSKELNTIVMQHPDYYRTYLRKALEKGESLEQALEYIKDFNI